MLPNATALTPRAREVLRCLAQSWNNKRVAEALCITEGTVKILLHHIATRLGLSGRRARALYALEHELL
jgi:DNA-binding NarL/FixJ family response regulator